MDLILLHSPWETEFFDRRIGEVIFPKYAEFSFLEENFELIQAKVGADEHEKIALLKQHGFEFVEGEIEFEWDLATVEKNLDWHIAGEEDIPILQMCFSHAFPHTRFQPPYFSSEENQRFYAEWIKNAVLGKFDDLCLIQRAGNGDLMGGISLKLQKKIAKVGLLNVIPEYQGQGIGKCLLQQAASWAVAQQADTLKITTQIGNLAAIGLYQSVGAKVVATRYWFYKLRVKR